MSFLDDIVSNIGQSLEQSVSTYASNEINSAIGGTMAYLFGGGQANGGDTLNALPDAIKNAFGGNPQQLSALTSDIEQQTAAIGEIANQLAFVSSAVKALTGEVADIQNLLNKINQEQLYSVWQDKNNLITQATTAISSTYDLYAEYIQSAIGLDTSNIADLASEIVNPVNGMMDMAGDISNLMVGQGGQDKGALQLWSEMVAPLVAAGLLDYREAVSQYMDYYSKLTYSQLQATNLLIEAYHFKNTKNLPGDKLADYKQLLLQQENQFIQYLVPLLVAGTQSFVWNPPPDGGVSHSTQLTFSQVDAAAQIHPGIQWLLGDPDRTSGYYAPSSVFMAAEKLLANLYVTKPADRRIVVHMVYPDGPNGSISSAVNAVPLTLSYANGTAKIQQTNQFGPYDYPLAGIDYNFAYYPAQIYLNRSVFTTGADGNAIPDGVYQLTNLNGHSGLQSINNYITANVPFQETRVLSYQMQIGATAPFDFMNFAAYTVGVPYIGDWGQE